MFLAQYGPKASRELAAALVAGAVNPSHTTSHANGARVLDIGGWQPSTWRTELRHLVQRGEVTALTLRTSPDDRQLTDQLWTHISRGVARRLGLAKQPWIAVRTSPTTVALITEAPTRPLPRAAAAAFVAQATIRYRLQRHYGLDGNRANTDKAPPATAATSPSNITQLNFTTPPDAMPNPTPTTTPQPEFRPPMNRPHTL